MELNDYLKTTTQSDFARLIGVTPAMVHQWSKSIRPVAAERCPEIEKATGGVIRCEDLRPDIDWAYLRTTGCRKGKKAV